MRKIAAVTVARSDYGILRPVLQALQDRTDVTLQLLVTGSHLSAHHGRTVQEIEADGLPIAARIDSMLDARATDSPVEIAAGMGREITGLSEAYEKLQPDLLLLLGDRFEMLAAACAALPFNMGIAHIHGGEASFGAIDDSMRHAITKLSHLHFPATLEYGRRLQQMGEHASRICVSGAPGLDNVKGLILPEPGSVAEKFGFPFDPDQPPIIVTYHAETRSALSPEDQIDQVLVALAQTKRPVLFTKPNADAGGMAITQRLEAFCDSHDGAFLVDSLGTANYFAMLRAAPAMVGNSSSGIIEAASFSLPVVNIGDRQKGRACGENVLHVGVQADAVAEAISTALSPQFRRSIAGIQNIYGDGNAAARISERLAMVPLSTEFLAKEFQDLTFGDAG